MARKEAASTDDLELFATFVRSEERRERDAKAAEKAARRAANEHDRLVKAKEEAAAEVKRLRSSERASTEQKAAAEEAYRLALAAVVAAETGTPPAWAEPVPDPDAVDDSAGDDSAGDGAAGGPDQGEASDADEAPNDGQDPIPDPSA